MIMKEPLLAATVKDINLLQYPLLGSPKLDGIRAINEKGKLLSRTMKLIPNVFTQKLFGDKYLHGMDGELVVGDPTAEDVWNATSSGIMTRDEKPRVGFYLFDYFIKPPGNKNFEPFEERSARLEQFCYEMRKEYDTRLKYWQHVQIESPEKLEWYRDTWVSAGYEGIMLRNPAGLYKFGRSTLKEGYLMKWKPFDDSEARIVGFEEQQHNANEKKVGAGGRSKRSSHKENMIPKDTLGAIIVKDLKNGMEFNIGTGFTDAQRDEIWAARSKWKNKIVKYKFQPAGTGEKPRFPVYMGIRDRRDL